MPTIDLTPENRPLIDAVLRLAATSWPQRDEAAEDELVKAILELVAWRKLGHVVAAIREYGGGDPAVPYDAQVSLATITQARRLLGLLDGDPADAAPHEEAHHG